VKSILAAAETNIEAENEVAGQLIKLSTYFDFRLSIKQHCHQVLALVATIVILSLFTVFRSINLL
jgi:hypothetical protein